MFEELDLASQIETFLSSAGESLDDFQENSNRKEEKGTYFGVVLYIDEDLRHQKFFNYILSHPCYEYVYIHHKGEGFNSEGVAKKDHTHMMVKTLDRMAVGAFVKYFEFWISHAECIHNPKTYVTYLLHQTPAAIESGKLPYPVSSLVGSPKLYNHLIQNSHFVELEEILKYHQDGASFLDTYHSLPPDVRAKHGDFMFRNRFFINSCIRDENQKFYQWCSWHNMTPVKKESEDL